VVGAEEFIDLVRGLMTMKEGGPAVLMTTGEAAAHLAARYGAMTVPASVRFWCDSDELDYAVVGGRYVIGAKALDEFWENRIERCWRRIQELRRSEGRDAGEP